MARTPSPNQRDCTGMTFVEACITAAVIAVGASLALPAFNDVVTTSRGRTAAHLISSQLASARQTAITRRIPVSVCPTLDGQRCNSNNNWSGGWLMYLDPQRRPQPSASDVLRVEMNDGKSLQIHSSTGRNAIRFQPNGKSSGSNATIHICREGDLLAQVIVNNLGRVRTERPKKPVICTG
jgi:type IV fimbrial biogenesis protein FimT